MDFASVVYFSKAILSSSITSAPLYALTILLLVRHIRLPLPGNSDADIRRINDQHGNDFHIFYRNFAESLLSRRFYTFPVGLFIIALLSILSVAILPSQVMAVLVGRLTPLLATIDIGLQVPHPNRISTPPPSVLVDRTFAAPHDS